MTTAMSIEKLFDRIVSITSSQEVNFLHLTEEVGEMATEMIVEKGLSYKEQDEGVLGEAIDALICILAIIANKTILFEDVLKAVDKKVAKWEKNYKKQQAKLAKKWTKEAPLEQGWYWIKYKGKRGMVKCPCEVTIEARKDSVIPAITIHSSRNDVFYVNHGDPRTKVRYRGTWDKSVRFMTSIPEPD